MFCFVKRNTNRMRSYTQLNEAVLVLLAIITETDSEDFDLQTKVLYEFLDLFFRNNSAKIAIFFLIMQLYRCVYSR